MSLLCYLYDGKLILKRAGRGIAGKCVPRLSGRRGRGRPKAGTGVKDNRHRALPGSPVDARRGQLGDRAWGAPCRSSWPSQRLPGVHAILADRGGPGGLGAWTWGPHHTTPHHPSGPGAQATRVRVSPSFHKPGERAGCPARARRRPHGRPCPPAQSPAGGLQSQLSHLHVGPNKP